MLKQVQHDGGEKHRIAFTLAEVLITLTIIGVIAALTIPNLMNKLQQKELETGFKKAHSLLSNTVQKAGIEAGSSLSDYIKANGNEATINLLLQQLKILKYDYYRNANFSSWYSTTTFARHGGTTTIYNMHYPNKIYYLNNGMYLQPFTTALIIDTNGYKRPNRWGYDIFLFDIDTNNNMLKANKNGAFYANYYCSKYYASVSGGNPAYNGVGCAYYASINKDPDDETKSYWENLEF